MSGNPHLRWELLRLSPDSGSEASLKPLRHGLSASLADFGKDTLTHTNVYPRLWNRTVRESPAALQPTQREALPKRAKTRIGKDHSDLTKSIEVNSRLKTAIRQRHTSFFPCAPHLPPACLLAPFENSSLPSPPDQRQAPLPKASHRASGALAVDTRRRFRRLGTSAWHTLAVQLKERCPIMLNKPLRIRIWAVGPAARHLESWTLSAPAPNTMCLRALAFMGALVAFKVLAGVWSWASGGPFPTCRRPCQLNRRRASAKRRGGVK